MAELVGEILRGRYRVEGLIRQFSALGGLYRAHDEELGRFVAIRIHDTIDGHAVGAWFVKNEARVLAQLSHPGVQQVYDAGEHEERYWYAAELLDAGSLEDAIESGSADSTLVLSSLKRVAQTIGYVHRRGFIHRNLHPGVLRFDVHGQPRVTGFGFATTTEDVISGKTPAAIGTMSYMAPELVVQTGEAIGPPADVWSLGAVLLCGLTRTNLLGPPMRSLFRELREYRPERVDDVVRETLRDQRSVEDAGCAEIAKRCLAASPSARYPDAGALAEDLQALGSPRVCIAPRVFVSHSTRDRAFVEREIVAPLERSGVPTWYAKADIDSAEQWERTIVHGLESAEWFILVMSPNSAGSEWVKDELHWAVKHRPDRILPVLIGECDPYAFHIRIARIQWIDLVENLAGGREALVERLTTGGV